MLLYVSICFCIILLASGQSFNLKYKSAVKYVPYANFLIFIHPALFGVFWDETYVVNVYQFPSIVN